MSELAPKQKAFAEAVVANGGDKVAALKEAGYSYENYNPASLRVQANKIYNTPKVNLLIRDLEAKAHKAAIKRASVTLAQRLEWLSEIVRAGLDTYVDQQGNARRENLTASSNAIKILNDMLGVDNSGNSVKPVKVIIGVEDASVKKDES